MEIRNLKSEIRRKLKKSKQQSPKPDTASGFGDSPLAVCLFLRISDFEFRVSSWSLHPSSLILFGCGLQARLCDCRVAVERISESRNTLLLEGSGT